MSEIWINYGGTAIAVKDLCRIRRQDNKVLLISSAPNHGAEMVRANNEEAILLYNHLCAKLGAVNAAWTSDEE